MYKMNKGSKSKLSSSRYSNTSVSQKSKNDSKRNIHDNNNNQQISSSQSKRARTSSHRKINQMSNKIFISKHMQIDNNHSIDNSEKQSNNSLHIRQTSYNPPQNVDVMFNQVNLQYHHKLADPLKVKCRDSCNRSMSNSKLKSKKKSKFSNIKISSIKLSDQSNINDTSALNNSISSSTNTKSRKANIEMKMKINQMIDQTCNFHKKVLSIDGYSSKSPHIVIPQGKIQIKQQYLNSNLINSKIGQKPKNSS